jgi:tripartite-type tricarboxylate transporter receptor subunit TctC
MKFKLIQFLCGICVGMAMTLPAMAQYPDKPIKLVVPFTPGGAADMMARTMALKLSADLKQQILIENRGGAGGTLASEIVAKAPADGYTLLFGNMGTHAINSSLYAKLRYHPVRDFAPISLTHYTARVLMVHPSLGVNSVSELISLARSKPGAIAYGSAGSGSSSHLSGAMFESLAGVDLLHVPYKGSAPLLTDVLAGRIQMTFDSFTVYEEHIKLGKVKVLGVTARERMSVLPAAPTIAESGLKGFEVLNWMGVLAPAGTPPEIVKQLNAAIVRTMKAPDLRLQLLAVGIDPVSTTPDEFASVIRSETVKWAEVVKRSGATAD